MWTPFSAARMSSSTAWDFFAFDARRLLFRKAREHGIWAVTAGPIGFSTAWLVFDPKGMSFDEYFDMHDGMEPVDQFVAFLVGLTPRATHFGYIDLSYVDAPSGRGPSVGLACNLASGVTAAEVTKVLLDRRPFLARCLGLPSLTPTAVYCARGGCAGQSPSVAAAETGDSPSADAEIGLRCGAAFRGCRDWGKHAEIELTKSPIDWRG